MQTNTKQTTKTEAGGHAIRMVSSANNYRKYMLRLAHKRERRDFALQLRQKDLDTIVIAPQSSGWIS